MKVRHPASRIPHPASLARYAPHTLLLAGGALGVLIAVERGPALREFRWLVVEPLLFYALLRWWGAERVVGAFVLSGMLVALIGLLQFVGLDLAPLLGEKQNFGTPNVVDASGLRRVTSVYGHPNNLGLFLGRVWPLAAALALVLPRRHEDTQARRVEHLRVFESLRLRVGWRYALAALICLAGLAVSLSRGAWLGGLAAAAVLALGASREHEDTRTRNAEETNENLRVFAPSRLRVPVFAALTALVILVGLALTLRGGLGGGSVDARVLLWREALAYLQARPIGLGLDQFYYYHNPEFGRSLIDPALIGTSEQFAAHPHNLLLDTWLNLTPLGLVGLGWLVVRLFRAGLARLRDGPNPYALGALAATSAALVHGLVDRFYLVPDLAFAFWLLVALAEARSEDLRASRTALERT
jgi:O-antigen ligase